MYWDFALFNLLFVLEIKDFKNREIIEWKWMFDIWDKHMDGVGGVAAHQYWFVRFQLCGVLLCLYASKGVGVDKYLDPFVSLATRAHVSVSKVRKQQKRKWESVLSPRQPPNIKNESEWPKYRPRQWTEVQIPFLRRKETESEWLLFRSPCVHDSCHSCDETFKPDTDLN